jgi:peptidoglycan-associated lipoprotein
MKIMTLIIASLLVAACSSAHKAESAPASHATTVTTPVASQATEAEAAANKLTVDRQTLQKASVYFEFDKFAVNPEFQDDIQKQANFMKGHSNDVVTIEGNCDERGSKSYNLALGNRRAKAVLLSLKKLGVRASQIKTVSFGKDSPRLLCHEEKCWKENRRVDFVHNLK